PPAQERHVPRRLRFSPLARVQGLLRPQTSRRQTPQRRTHLPRPPPLQRHLGHAPHRPALPHPRPTTPPPPPRMTLDKNMGTPPPGPPPVGPRRPTADPRPDRPSRPGTTAGRGDAPAGRRGVDQVL